MPRFSIILPTYNRRDTIGRAIASIRAQTFSDWELVVVDDGSTDGTGEALENIDPRVMVVRQANRGVAGARNRGLRESRGNYIAFLDSDDEWLPHHLELANAFFGDHPEEHLFSGEFWIDYRTGEYQKHFRESMGNWFAPVARKIRSDSLALPAGETDDYLRFYSTRRPVGSWARPILERLPYKDVFHYDGDLFQLWRWGFLLAVQSTVISRTALERIGPFDESYRVASDFGFLAEACRHFRSHMVSAPACIKHEYAPEGARPAESHLATGSTALEFAKDLLRWHDELFWNGNRDDRELSALRAVAEVFVARVALGRGRPEEAVPYLSDAVARFPTAEARILLALAHTRPPIVAQTGARLLSQVTTRYTSAASRVRAKLRPSETPEHKRRAAVAVPSAAPTGDIEKFEGSGRDEVMALRAAIYAGAPIFTSASYFDWMYDAARRIDGRAPELWLHRSDGRVDGEVGAVPIRLKVDRESYDGCWVLDLGVHPSGRGKGIAATLADVASARASIAVAIEVTPPGLRVLTRTGWTYLGDPPLYVRPLAISSVMRGVAGRLPPAATAAGDGLLRFTASAAARAAERMALAASEIDRFDQRADEIWQNAYSAYPVVGWRDSEYLNNRFASFPGRPYRLFYFSHEEEWVGYAVLRVGSRHGMPAGYVIDYFCKPRWTFGILAQCTRWFERERVAAVYCLQSLRSGALPALGFVPRKSGWPLVADLRHLPPEAARIASKRTNWFVTAGDGDVDRPE